MKKSELEEIFTSVKMKGAKYIGVSILTQGSSEPEIIINPKENLDEKSDYYMKAYDDDLILITTKGRKNIRIIDAGYGNNFEDIESQLVGERGRGWKELISTSIEKAYERMIVSTPPKDDEEKENCKMIKEAIKGMFINERRTAVEAEFIKLNIEAYDRLFDICMNGTGLEYRRGLAKLQRMQNEYVLQREREKENE